MKKDYQSRILSKLRKMSEDYPGARENEEAPEVTHEEENIQDNADENKVPPGEHNVEQPPEGQEGADSIGYREVCNDARIGATRLLQALDNFEKDSDLDFYSHVSEEFSDLREKLDLMIKSPEDYIDSSTYAEEEKKGIKKQSATPVDTGVPCPKCGSTKLEEDDNGVFCTECGWYDTDEK